MQRPGRYTECIVEDSQSTPGSATSMPQSRLRHFKTWSEQTSSSGKRYYYNRESEVSQWEKPSEWKEYERSLASQHQQPQSASKGPSRGVVSTPSPSLTSSPLVRAAKARVDPPKLAPPSSSVYEGEQRGVKRPNVESSTLLTTSVLPSSHSSNYPQGGYPANKYRRECSQSFAEQQSLNNRPITQQQCGNDGTLSSRFGGTPAAAQMPRTPHAGCSTPFSSTPTPLSSQCQPMTRATHMPATPRDDRYLRLYRPDTTTFRRGWAADHYAAEAKRLAEKRRVQDAAISAVDEDIISVQSLLKTAESKSSILAKKLQMMGQRIAALEGKSL